MDVRAAFAATLRAMTNNRKEADMALGSEASDPCSLVHLLGMQRRLLEEELMPYGKQCRWLGYLQGVAVARSLLTLDDVKAINKEYANVEGGTAPDPRPASG